MMNKMVSSTAELNKLKITPLSAYIEDQLSYQRKSWSALIRYMGWPKPYITRLRRHGFIPSPRDCTIIAGFLNVPWYIVWVQAGHMRQEDVNELKSASLSYTWRLTPLEAELIGAFRSCNPRSREYLHSAVRGAARASENMASGRMRQHRMNVLLEMDFVNEPEWLDAVPKVDIGDYKDVIIMNEDNHFGYIPQSGVVGSMRFAVTGQMSPLPRSIYEDASFSIPTLEN